MIGRSYIIILLLIFCSLVFCQTLVPAVDGRASGMGKAFVGQSLMNPANLGYKGNFFGGDQAEGEEGEEGKATHMRFNAFVAGEYTVGGQTLETLDEINDIIESNGGINNFQSSFTGTPTTTEIQDATRLINAIAKLEDHDDSGAYVDATLHVDFFFQNMGIYFSSWGNVGLEPRADLNNLGYSSSTQFNTAANEIWGNSATDHTGSFSSSQEAYANSLESSTGITDSQADELVYQAIQAGVDVTDSAFQQYFTQMVSNMVSDSGNITDNQSGVIARSFALYEFNLSYGQSFLDIVSVGVNFKATQMYLYEESITLQNIDKAEDLYDDIQDGTYFDKRVRRVERFNLDAGATVRPLPNLSVGVLARNLIPYSYRYSDGHKLDMHTQYRVGASYSMDMITVAVDVDLNRIHFDNLREYKAQLVSAGVEISPLSAGSPLELLIRLGAYKNVAEEDEDTIITTGVGVKFWKIVINAGGHVSWFKTVTVRSGDNDYDVFESAGFAVNAAFATDF